MTTTVPAAAPAATPARHYGASALASGLVRMWRATGVVLTAVGVNAVAQAALIVGDPVPARSWSFAVLAAASFVVFLVSYGLLLAAALGVHAGRVGLRSAAARLGARALPYLLWATGLLVVVMIGLALYSVPGWVVIAVMPYLLLAVLDGRRNPVGADLAAIRARLGRWLATVIIMAGISLVLWVLSAVNAFFVGGWVAALITWLVLGLVTAWFTTTWALIYRSTPAGAA